MVFWIPPPCVFEFGRLVSCCSKVVIFRGGRLAEKQGGGKLVGEETRGSWFGASDHRMAGNTVVPKEWRNDTKDHCAATDASIRKANRLREEAEWLIEGRKNVTDRAQKDVKFRLTEKVTDTQRYKNLSHKRLAGTWPLATIFSSLGGEG